jgi:mycothiol synthase
VNSPALDEVDPAAFATQRRRVERIEERASERAGHPTLGDAVWRDLDSPQADSALFFADDTAVAHIARNDNFSPRHWALGVTSVEADAAAQAPLIEAALHHVGAHGGGRVAFWVLGASAADDRVLTGLGFRADRELHEMRVPLPLAEQPKLPAGVRVRTFEPGRDEAAWLNVNNRAFANHDEQGDWIEETLHRRMRETWFDPTVFFLAFDDDGLAGFNWIKIHTNERDERLGEIFVIGVDPRMQGSGLGRALAIIGLDAAAERGISTGSLFVAAENAGAHHLYESLGFTVYRVDRAYETDVAAS